MNYYFNKTLENVSFEEVLDRVSSELQKEGFGVLTEIDVRATFKKKLDIDFRNYRILGACNPHFALKALEAEDKIGTMLPCNVIVQQTSDTQIEIAAVDPVASMLALENIEMAELAKEIRSKLERVITNS